MVHAASDPGGLGWRGRATRPFDGPVEFDETYIGGLRKNKSNKERAEATGRGPVDMTAVDRRERPGQQPGRRQGGAQHRRIGHCTSFVDDMTDPDTVVYTDDAADLRRHP